MPTFNPKSEARGRTSEGLFWATVVAVTSKHTTAARIFLVIAEDYICGSRLWSRASWSEPLLGEPLSDDIRGLKSN
jgi:hypothetical protein